MKWVKLKLFIFPRHSSQISIGIAFFLNWWSYMILIWFCVKEKFICKHGLSCDKYDFLVNTCMKSYVLLTATFPDVIKLINRINHNWSFFSMCIVRVRRRLWQKMAIFTRSSIFLPALFSWGLHYAWNIGVFNVYFLHRGVDINLLEDIKYHNNKFDLCHLYHYKDSHLIPSGIRIAIRTS